MEDRKGYHVASGLPLDAKHTTLVFDSNDLIKAIDRILRLDYNELSEALRNYDEVLQQEYQDCIAFVREIREKYNVKK